MAFPILVDFALKNAGKYIAKNFGLKVLNSKGARILNTREDYAINAYRNKSSKLYKNKNLIKEYYNSDLPIDKKVSKWNEKDLINVDYQIKDKKYPVYKSKTVRVLYGIRRR